MSEQFIGYSTAAKPDAKTDDWEIAPVIIPTEAELLKVIGEGWKDNGLSKDDFEAVVGDGLELVAIYRVRPVAWHDLDKGNE